MRFVGYVIFVILESVSAGGNVVLSFLPCEEMQQFRFSSSVQLRVSLIPSALKGSLTESASYIFLHSGSVDGVSVDERTAKRKGWLNAYLWAVKKMHYCRFYEFVFSSHWLLDPHGESHMGLF